jgi:hypothetical protein
MQWFILAKKGYCDGRLLGCGRNYLAWLFNLNVGVLAGNMECNMKKETAAQMKERIRNELARLAKRSIVQQWFWEGEYGYLRRYLQRRLPRTLVARSRDATIFNDGE